MSEMGHKPPYAGISGASANPLKADLDGTLRSNDRFGSWTAVQAAENLVRFPLQSGPRWFAGGRPLRALQAYSKARSRCWYRMEWSIVTSWSFGIHFTT